MSLPELRRHGSTKHDAVELPDDAWRVWAITGAGNVLAGLMGYVRHGASQANRGGMIQVKVQLGRHVARGSYDDLNSTLLPH